MTTSAPGPAPLPLDGVLVADFTRVLAGPLATMTLADLGADIVKVERPGIGDDTRQLGPPWTPTSSSYFECANRSKRSVQFDLDDPGDRALATELALRADVLVENFLDGTLARFGLGYDDLRERNPRLVYVSVTGFGSRGGAALPGYDVLLQAVGGLMSVTGPAEEPHKVGVALVDVLTAKDAVIGTLAALRARERTGRGQRVEVNLLSSLQGALANQAHAYLTTGQIPRRMGNRHPSIAPYETFLAGDGPVAICCGNDGQFRRLAVALGRPELAADPRFATNAARVEHRDAMVAALDDTLAADTAQAWTDRLTEAGVPAGRVGTIADGLHLAERLGLDPLVDVGPTSPRQVRHPVTYSGTPVERYTAPPGLGEHDAELRRWLAGPRAGPRGEGGRRDRPGEPR